MQNGLVLMMGVEKVILFVFSDVAQATIIWKGEPQLRKRLF